ncbi:MAG: hypothetical protein JJU33_09925 [Phycisphaerales bacterium]|nr:hypothetical protein [Phycisphaerales bacterium]
MTRRAGIVLLELMVAVALFVGAGLAITNAMTLGVDSAIRAEREIAASDIARSAMAKIQAGISTPQTLSGEPVAWDEDETVWEGDRLVSADDLPAGRSTTGPVRTSGWVLSVNTEPSSFDGLSQVIVEVRRAEADAESLPEATLKRLVRLRDAPEDTAGDIDALVGEAERGAPRRNNNGTGR